MKKIMAIMVIAVLIFHLGIVFNRPVVSFPKVSLKMPQVTFKLGFLEPHTTLPTAGTFKPMVHAHTTFFNL